MKPLAFVFPYWLLFWATFVWVFGAEGRYMRRAVAEGGGRTAKDGGSMWLVVLGNYVGTIAGFVAAFRVRDAAMPHPLAMFWLGIAVLISGSLLRRHCFRVLGEYFTYDVQTRAEQPVIETGAYRWVRHPSYTGGILMFAGLGVALGNWASLAIFVVTVLAVYAYRVKKEEQVLVAELGHRYREYMARTKRFIPFVI